MLFLFGWGRLRVLAFPIAFLLLMIPIPAIIFNQIAFPLQIFASRVGESALELSNIPVLREGNVLILANTTLEVAEACSGIRSLVSLITLAIVFGYFSDPRPWVRTLIALAAVPIAIADQRRASGGHRHRGATTTGPAAAEGFIPRVRRLAGVRRGVCPAGSAAAADRAHLAAAVTSAGRRSGGLEVITMLGRASVLFVCFIAATGVIARASHIEPVPVRTSFDAVPDADRRVARRARCRRSPTASWRSCGSTTTSIACTTRQDDTVRACTSATTAASVRETPSTRR